MNTVQNSPVQKIIFQKRALMSTNIIQGKHKSREYCIKDLVFSKRKNASFWNF